MTQKYILITGANSYLGNIVIRELLKTTNFHIIGIISPRHPNQNLLEKQNRLQYYVSDLTLPLSSHIQSIIASADIILHFAWFRGYSLKRVTSKNIAMIDTLMPLKTNPKKFFFISSVSASPKALSIYGKTKYIVMQEIEKRGGSSLVCGLVMGTPPQGPFKLLTKIVKNIPISVRFKKEDQPEVYPIQEHELLSTIRQICINPPLAGNYKMFSPPLTLNDFLYALEQKYLRCRISIIFSCKSTIRFVLLLKSLKLLPMHLIDKILTFLIKDPYFLSSLPPLNLQD